MIFTSVLMCDRLPCATVHSFITLANVGNFKNSVTGELGKKFATLLYSISHHTLDVLLTYLEKYKIAILRCI